MDAQTFIDDNGLAYRYASGTYAVHDGVTQGSGATLDEALAAFLGSLVDRRVALAAPLDAYAAVDGADVAVLAAYAGNTPMPVVLKNPVLEAPGGPGR